MFYPICLPGHMFYLENRVVERCFFNNEQNYNGAIDSLERLTLANEIFKGKSTKLRKTKLNYADPINDLLSTKIITTINLLEKIGFEN